MALILGSSLLAPGAVKSKQNFHIYKQRLQVIDYPEVSEASVDFLLRIFLRLPSSILNFNYSKFNKPSEVICGF